MSLFGSLQTASNTLQAVQIGLQVVGNNIANANTEGFIREQVNYAPAPVQEIGNLAIGLGVQIDSITQQVDQFLANQVRDATGERVSADIQNDAYKNLEQILGELTDGDLSTSLTRFFNQLENTLDAVSGDQLSTRNLAVIEGQRLATDFRRIESAAEELRNGYDNQIASSVDRINSLAEEIAKFNVRITQTEAGQNSEAGALRSSRNQALSELAELIEVSVSEQPSGGLSVAVDGEFLVFEGQRRQVSLESGEGNEQATTSLVFADTGAELRVTSGRIHGLTVARDEIVDGFREDLNGFASTLISEFNSVYSQGQGLDGFTSLTSVSRVTDANAPLDEAGLPFPLAAGGGSFNLTVVSADGATNRTTIDVNLLSDGAEERATLASVAEQITAIEGLEAEIDANGRLSIATDTRGLEFTFSEDSSGLLSSLGLNTFFTGTSARDIGVNSELEGVQNAGKLALALPGDERENGNAGLTGLEPAPPRGTTGNAQRLAAFIDQPIESLNGASITERFDQVTNELAQQSSIAQSVADGLGVFESTLQTEFQSVSGVNIDEEAIDMISLQRIYQATARVIQTIQAMLDTLINI